MEVSQTQLWRSPRVGARTAPSRLGRCAVGRSRWMPVVILAALALALLRTPAALASGPVWSLSSSHSPEVVALTPRINQVETLTVSGEANGVPAHPNVGRFELLYETFAGEEEHTKPLSYGVTAAEVQSALEALSGIGAGNVNVTGGPTHAGGAGQDSWTYVLTFGGALAGRPLPEVEAEEIPATKAEEKKVKEEGQSPVEGIVEWEVEPEGLGDTVDYRLLAKNVGSVATSGKITLKDTLPAGLSTAETAEGTGWSCSPLGENHTVVTCTTEAVVAPGSEATPVEIEAYVDTAAVKEGAVLVNRATISGGGAAVSSEASDPTPIASMPSAVTGSASALTPDSATLNGTVNPGGIELRTCEFEYGPTGEYGSVAPCASSPVSGTSPVAVSAPVAGLKSDTTYHFRFVAASEAGISEGGDQTFRTPLSAEEEAIAKKHEEEATTKKHEEEVTTKKQGEGSSGVLGATEASPAPAVGNASLAGRPIRVENAREAAVKLTCAGTATCTGKLTLTVRRATPKSKKGRAETIGTVSFSVAAGKTTTIKITLDPRGRALLSASHGRLNASLTILKQSPSPAKTQTESVTLLHSR